MKFGLWISGHSESEIVARASQAQSMGFDCVGLRAGAAGSGAALALPVACVADAVALTQIPNHQAEIDGLRSSIAAARARSASLIVVQAEAAGRTTSQSINQLAPPLRAAADLAAQQGIRLCVSNRGPRPLARDLWALLDRCQHPNLSALWDASAAARAGERSSVSIPLLNSRIAAVHVELTPDFSTFEQTDAAIEALIHRLLGVGFDGHVLLGASAPWPKQTPPVGPLLEKLKKWNQRPAPGRKAAATHAPISRAASDAAPASAKKAPATPAGA